LKSLAAACFFPSSPAGAEEHRRRPAAIRPCVPERPSRKRR
jgi:hypothetical protein